MWMDLRAGTVRNIDLTRVVVVRVGCCHGCCQTLRTHANRWMQSNVDDRRPAAGGARVFEGAARSVVAAIAGSLGGACPVKRSSRPGDPIAPVALRALAAWPYRVIAVAWACAR